VRRAVQSLVADADAPVRDVDKRRLQEAGELRGTGCPSLRALHLVRVDQTLRMTPAMAYGIAHHILGIGELIASVA
jgi:hypothetical protein